MKPIIITLFCIVSGCALFQGQEGRVKGECPRACDGIEMLAIEHCAPLCEDVLTDADVPEVSYAVCDLGCQEMVGYGSSCVAACEQAVDYAYKTVDAL